MISPCYACQKKRKKIEEPNGGCTNGGNLMTQEKKLYRSIQKIIRVTPEENRLLKERMSLYDFKNFNTYARYLLLTGEIIQVDFSELTKLRTAINRIGTNINQLARYVNTNEEISLEQYQTLQANLAEVKQLMERHFNQEMKLLEARLNEKRDDNGLY